jgi:hypothetical protein
MKYRNAPPERVNQRQIDKDAAQRYSGSFRRDGRARWSRHPSGASNAAATRMMNLEEIPLQIHVGVCPGLLDVNAG